MARADCLDNWKNMFRYKILVNSQLCYINQDNIIYNILPTIVHHYNGYPEHSWKHIMFKKIQVTSTIFWKSLDAVDCSSMITVTLEDTCSYQHRLFPMFKTIQEAAIPFSKLLKAWVQIENIEKPENCNFKPCFYKIYLY